MGEAPPRRVLFIFLDGVGVGPNDPAVNPFLRARLPILREALGGGAPTLDAPKLTGGVGRSLPLDASLGVEGTPQSGTGQTALLTGSNAAARYGRHFGPWVPVALRDLLARDNLLVEARSLGLSAAFANAYPTGYVERYPKRLAAVPLAAHAADLLNRHLEALAGGDAVASEIVNTGWRRRLGAAQLPEITPTRAGRNLAEISNAHDLTFFAHYSTDNAGHRGGMEACIRALERVDAFLGGVMEGASADTTIVLASDHGNIEDVRSGHTLNPAMCIVLGDAKDAFEASDLTEVWPSLRAALAGC